MAAPTMDGIKLSTRALQYCVETWNAKDRNWQASHPNKLTSYKGQCVGVLRRSWRAAGVIIQGMDSCSNPSAYMRLLRSPVGRQFYQECRPADIINKPCIGDVVLYHGGKTVGHGAIFCQTQWGGKWVSDAVQRSYMVYSKHWDLCAFRYIGPISMNGTINYAAALSAYNGTTSYDYSGVVKKLQEINTLFANNHDKLAKNLFMI